MIFAYEGMAQNAILRKIAKIYVFWLFDRLLHSGRNGDIWPEIGHLGAEEAQKTIEHQKIVSRAHFEKIEKKSSFYPKNGLKKFSKSIFTGRSCPDNKSISLEDTSYRAPQTPILWALSPASYHIPPTCWISVVKYPKSTFFGFFYLSGPLKWIT